MEESRTDPVPGTPYPAPGVEQQAAPELTAWQQAASAETARRLWEEPSERAVPLLVLTPAPELGAARESRPWDVHVVVTGVAVLVITAELGRRAGVPPRLAAVCSAAGFTVVLVPRLISAVPRPRPRSRHREAVAVAMN